MLLVISKLKNNFSLAVGLWEANAGIGESLYKIGQYEDSVSPISESIALLEAEQKNIDGEIKRMKKLLRRANKKAGKDFGNESDSSVNTLRSAARPPKILNTLQVFFYHIWVFRLSLTDITYIS